MSDHLLHAEDILAPSRPWQDIDPAPPHHPTVDGPEATGRHLDLSVSSSAPKPEPGMHTPQAHRDKGKNKDIHRRMRPVVELPSCRGPKSKHKPPHHQRSPSTPPRDRPSPSPSLQESSADSSDSFAPSENSSSESDPESDEDSELATARTGKRKRPSRSSRHRRTKPSQLPTPAPAAQASPAPPRIANKADYARWTDYARRAFTQLHGEIRCVFCPPVQSGLKPRGSINRLPDAAARHLRDFCPRFDSSAVYRAQLARLQADQPQSTSTSTVGDGAAKHEARKADRREIVARLVREGAKIAVAQVHCRADPGYRARCAALGLSPADVEAKLGRHAVLYKMEDCECCQLPKWDEYVAGHVAQAKERRKQRQRQVEVRQEQPVTVGVGPPQAETREEVPMEVEEDIREEDIEMDEVRVDLHAGTEVIRAKRKNNAKKEEEVKNIREIRVKAEEAHRSAKKTRTKAEAPKASIKKEVKEEGVRELKEEDEVKEVRVKLEEHPVKKEEQENTTQVRRSSRKRRRTTRFGQTDEEDEEEVSLMLDGRLDMIIAC